MVAATSGYEKTLSEALRSRLRPVVLSRLAPPECVRLFRLKSLHLERTLSFGAGGFAAFWPLNNTLILGGGRL